jgi:hypothetical protein
MEYLTAEEVASILGIGRRQLGRHVRKGLLRQFHPEGKQVPYYDPEEVTALLNIRNKSVSSTALSMLVKQTSMRVTHLEKIVEQLITALGANIEVLPIDKDSVVALWYRAKAALEAGTGQDTKEVLAWAGIFSAIGEEHLEVLATALELEEPYNVFTKLGKELYKKYPYGLEDDPGAKGVLQLLNVSRDKLRRVMESYISMTSGKVLGYEIFPKSKGDAHTDIVALIVEKKRRRTTSKVVNPDTSYPCT